jgi:hypothetical protein
MENANKKPRAPDATVLSRRDVIRGAAAAALVGATGAASLVRAENFAARRRQDGPQSSLLRYMSGAAVLGDGKILITGGYDRPLSGTDVVRPLSSAVVFDPQTGKFWPVAPMQVPRARHAAVALKDGRVAVIGGIALQPTASIEVYDPGTDSWSHSQPLAQPRYDHVAAYDGDTVYVIGGSSLRMLTGVEAVRPGL